MWISIEGKLDTGKLSTSSNLCEWHECLYLRISLVSYAVDPAKGKENDEY